MRRGYVCGVGESGTGEEWCVVWESWCGDPLGLRLGKRRGRKVWGGSGSVLGEFGCGKEWEGASGVGENEGVCARGR